MVRGLSSSENSAARAGMDRTYDQDSSSAVAVLRLLDDQSEPANLLRLASHRSATNVLHPSIVIAILGDEPDSTRVASAMTKVNVPWQRTASARDIDPPREDDWDVAKH